MDRMTGKRASPDDDFSRRQRIQKLRWLGLDHEADRLAAEALTDNKAARAPLPLEYLDTD